MVWLTCVPAQARFLRALVRAFVHTSLCGVVVVQAKAEVELDKATERKNSQESLLRSNLERRQKELRDQLVSVVARMQHYWSGDSTYSIVRSAFI